MGPQPQVDTVVRAEIGRLADQPHGLLHHAIEKLLVGAGLGALNAAVDGMHEDEVDVARIVELAATELPQRDRGDRGPAAIAPPRHPALPLHAGQRRLHGRVDDAIGHVRNLRDHRLQPLLLDDVAVGDAERLPPLEAAQGPHHALGIVAHPDLGGERRGELLPFLGPAPAYADRLPGLGVGDHELGKVRACREDPEQNLERPWIPFEQGGGRQWVASSGHETLKGHEHTVGVGDVRQERGQPAHERHEQVAGHTGRGECHDRAVGDRGIVEASGQAPVGGGGWIIEQAAYVDRCERRTGRLEPRLVAWGGWHLTPVGIPQPPPAARSWKR